MKSPSHESDGRRRRGRELTPTVRISDTCLQQFIPTLLRPEHWMGNRSADCSRGSDRQRYFGTQEGQQRVHPQSTSNKTDRYLQSDRRFHQATDTLHQGLMPHLRCRCVWGKSTSAIVENRRSTSQRVIYTQEVVLTPVPRYRLHSYFRSHLTLAGGSLQVSLCHRPYAQASPWATRIAFHACRYHPTASMSRLLSAHYGTMQHRQLAEQHNLRDDVVSPNLVLEQTTNALTGGVVIDPRRRSVRDHSSYNQSLRLSPYWAATNA